MTDGVSNSGLADGAQTETEAQTGAQTEVTADERAEFTPCVENVVTGSVTITSLAELEALQDVTHVTGALFILEFDSELIPGLDCLESVDGSLSLSLNPSTTRITGFPRLERIGENLFIDENPALTTVDGFPRLRTIGGDLSLQANRSNPTIGGFDALYSIGGALGFDSGSYTIVDFSSLERIEGGIVGGDGGDFFAILGMNDLSSVGRIRLGNIEHIDLRGLQDLSVVEGHLDLFGSQLSEETFAGFEELDEIGGRLAIYNCAGIIEGFPELERIGGGLSLDESSFITAIRGFSELEEIGGGFSVQEITLTVIEGFDDLETIGGDMTIAGTELEELGGFDDLEEIGGTLWLSDMNLLRLSGFRSLRSVGSDLVLTSLGPLGQLDAFTDLDVIGGDLEVSHTDELRDLDAINDLHQIGGSLRLEQNDGLEAIGLPDLETVAGDLSIQFNRRLPTCDAEEFWADLVDNGFTGSKVINGNDSDECI